MNEQALNARDDRLHIPELARRARLRKLLWLAVLLAVVGLAAAYYTRPQPEPELYRVDAAALRTIVQLIETTGTVDVRSRVEVPAPIAGRLTAIHVQPRQEVKAGDLLATLDERAAELSLRTARATAEAANGRLAQAQASLAAAREAEARAKRLNEKGLASDQELADAQAARQRASAALDVARAERKVAVEQVATAELGKSLGKIVAPAPGVVVRAPDRIGAAVSPDQGPLFVIGAPLDTMRVDALVGESDIAQVTPGRKAEVLVSGLPGRTFEASVERIGIEPKRDGGGVVQYPVTLLVQNPDGALLPGMSARVRMEVARAEQALSVHEAALRFTPEGVPPAPPRSRVFVKEGAGNELREVSVEAGVSDGVYTAVAPKGGARLEPGDDVAIGLLRPDLGGKKPNVSLGGK